MSREFRFSGSYLVSADRTAAIARLRDADQWPTWWPQIRAVERYDNTSGIAHVRSLLPITLRIGLARQIDDPATGLLRARLFADLDGWLEFRVDHADAPGSCRVAYRQECALTHPVLRRVAPALRPVLLANHHAMMRAGMRGLGRAGVP